MAEKPFVDLEFAGFGADKDGDEFVVVEGRAIGRVSWTIGMECVLLFEEKVLWSLVTYTRDGWFCRFSCGQKLGVGVSSTSSFKVASLLILAARPGLIGLEAGFIECSEPMRSS